MFPFFCDDTKCALFVAWTRLLKHVTLTSQHSRLGEFLKGLKVLDIVMNVLGQNNLSLMHSARGSHEEHFKH